MTKGETTLFVVIVSVLVAPFVVCAGVTMKYTPTETDTSAGLPACTTCDVCRSRDEDLVQNMAAYVEGVRHGKFGEFNSYVAEICDGKPACFTAFAELRAKYDESAATELE